MDDIQKRIEKLAETIQTEYKALGIPFKTAQMIVRDLDSTSDEIDKRRAQPRRWAPGPDIKEAPKCVLHPRHPVIKVVNEGQRRATWFCSRCGFVGNAGKPDKNTIVISHSQTPKKKPRSEILAEFTTILNAFGADSGELMIFRALHKGDKELQKMFAAAVEDWLTKKRTKEKAKKKPRSV